jgi:paraquat-inducible protein A
MTTTIACHECDALQEEPRRVPRGATVKCWRCNAILRRETKPALFVLALIVTGIVLFVIANAFPLVSLEAGGNRNSATLLGTVIHMWAEGRQPVAVLVFVTTILAPAFQLGTMLFLVLAIVRVEAGHAASMPRFTAPLLRMVRSARPWAMLEVFMLGALVSIVKLGSLASVIVDFALYSIGALIFVFAAIDVAFDPRDAWSRLPVRAPDDRPVAAT